MKLTRLALKKIIVNNVHFYRQLTVDQEMDFITEIYYTKKYRMVPMTVSRYLLWFRISPYRHGQKSTLYILVYYTVM